MSEANRNERLVIRAFRVDMPGFDIMGIVFAVNASKARYAAYRTAKDAGFAFEFREISIRRAPEFDCRETIHGKIPVTGSCFLPKYLRRAA
jgi:hypothetical protein